MESEGPLKFAVIGTGYLGRFHAQKYAKAKDVELLYCIDSNLKQAQAVAEEVGSKALDDYTKVLNELDAVSIVVPTPLHYEVDKECLNSGLDILVEKPVTETSRQAKELVDLAKKESKIFMVGHLERFNPPIMKMRDSLVKPAFIQAERLGPFKERAANIDVVLDLMIHDLDIILSFVKSPVKRISGVGIPVLSDKVDIANVRLEFENNTAANLTASRISLGDAVRKIKIFQHENYISIDYNTQKMAVFTLGEGKSKDPMSRIQIEEIKLDQADALEQEILAFIHSVKTREAPPVSGEDGKIALDVALEIISVLEKTPGPGDIT
jgi:predicted dehydrogenase